MTELSQKKCVACEGFETPFVKEEAVVLLRELNKDPDASEGRGSDIRQTANRRSWTLSDDAKRISKHFDFEDFKEALAFVNKVGAIAEEEGHHPDITFTWGKVDIELTTHAIKGLSENDFILAAKIDELS